MPAHSSERGCFEGETQKRKHSIYIHFPTVPLKNIDVIRSTHTDLDVAQEKRIDDYWNVDGNRNLSDSWTGFTSLNETHSRGFMWSGERLTTIQTTSRPDHFRPDAWIRVGSAAKRNKKR